MSLKPSIPVIICIVFLIIIAVNKLLPENSEDYLRKALHEKGGSSVADFKIGDTNGVLRNVDRLSTKYLFDLFIDGSEPTNGILGIGSCYAIKIKMANGAAYNADLIFDAKSGIITIALPPKLIGLEDEQTFIARKLTNAEETLRTFQKTIDHLGIHDL